MALRDLLARFRITVDRTQLTTANAQIDRSKASLTQLTALTSLKPITLSAAALTNVQTQAQAASAAFVKLKASGAALKATRAEVRLAPMSPAAIASYQRGAATIKAQLATVRAALAGMGASGATGSPQLLALRRQAQLLESQLRRTDATIQAASAAAASGAAGVRQLAAGHRSASAASTRLSSALARVSAMGTAVAGKMRSAAVATTQLAAKQKTATATSGGLGGAMNLLKGAALGFVAAIGIGAFSGFISETLSAADAIGKQAKRLGIATAEVQIWNAAAALGGASSAEMSTAFVKLSRNMNEAAAGTGPAAAAFKALGIDVKKADGSLKGAHEAMVEVGGQLGAMTDPTKRVALAQDLLGRSGAKLIPAFGNGTAAMQEQIETLRDLAVVYDDDFIASVEEANDKMHLAGLQFDKIRALIVNFLLPVFTGLATKMTPMISGFAKWAKASGVLDRALKALATMGILKVIGMLFTKLGGITGLLRLAARIVLRFLLPFLLLDDIITWLEGGDSLLGRWIDKMFGFEGAGKLAAEAVRKAFDTLVGTLKFVWGMLAGDKAAMAEGEQAALDFYNFFKTLFEDLGAWLSDWWANQVPGWVQVGLAALFVILTGGLGALFLIWQVWGDDIGALWGSVVDTISTAWTTVGDFVTGVWQTVADTVTGIIDGMIDGITGGVDRGITAIGGLLKKLPGGEALTGALGISTAAATPNAPAGGNRSTQINVTDNSRVSTAVHGVAPAGIGPTLRAEGNANRQSLQKRRSATLQQLAGAR